MIRTLTLATLFCLLIFGLLFWRLLLVQPTSQTHPFNPTKEIRIEFPRFGGGLSQGVAPIIDEEWSGPAGFSYEITNNVLEHERMHYLPKTGDLVRFEFGGAISINRMPAGSIEKIGMSAPFVFPGIWPM